MEPNKSSVGRAQQNTKVLIELQKEIQADATLQIGKSQARILYCLREYMLRTGNWPTHGEISFALNLCQPVISSHMDKLEKLGLIRRSKLNINSQRCAYELYQPYPAAPDTEMSKMNVVGLGEFTTALESATRSIGAIMDTLERMQNTIQQQLERE